MQPRTTRQASSESDGKRWGTGNRGIARHCAGVGKIGRRYRHGNDAGGATVSRNLAAASEGRRRGDDVTTRGRSSRRGRRAQRVRRDCILVNTRVTATSWCHEDGMGTLMANDLKSVYAVAMVLRSMMKRDTAAQHHFRGRGCKPADQYADAKAASSAFQALARESGSAKHGKLRRPGSSLPT